MLEMCAIIRTDREERKKERKKERKEERKKERKYEDIILKFSIIKKIIVYHMQQTALAINLVLIPYLHCTSKLL